MRCLSGAIPRSVHSTLLKDCAVVAAMAAFLVLLMCPLADSLDRFEIIERGKAKEYLKKYEEDARDLELKGDLKKAASKYKEASGLARNAGDYQRGILAGTRAIELSQKADAPWIQAQSLLQTAKSYQAIADHEKALELLAMAAELASVRGWKAFEAKVYEETGSVYKKLSDVDKAAEYLKRSYQFYERVMNILEAPGESLARREEKIRNKFSRPGHIRNIIDILIAMGDISSKRDDDKSAMDYYRKALYYAADSKDRLLKIHCGIGDLYSRRGNYRKALEHHKKACELSDSLNIPAHTVASYARAGWDHQSMENFEEAIAHFRKAIDAVEDMRSLLQSEEMRSSFFEQMTRVYSGMISSLISLGKPEEAFNYSERARARTFLDILGTKVDLSRGRASALAEEEQQLKRKMMSLQIRIEEADTDSAEEAEGDSPEKSGPDTTDCRKELDDLKKQYLSFLERLRREDLEHASLVSVEPFTLKDVQSLLAPQKVVLEYHVLGSRTILWVIRKDSLKTVIIPHGRGEIMRAIRMLRKSIAEVSSEEKVGEVLQELSGMFLRDAGIEKGTEIIVVPHDILHYLPFHALLSPEGKYLIEDHVISYLSSSSIMRFTRGKRKKATDNILAFGNPELDNPVYNLRYAEREAKEIGRIFPGTDVFIRNDATESRAKGLSGSYDVLHFASHAVFNEKHPEDTSLMLAMDQWDDGQFSVDEIFSLNLRSSLVVLSACNTDIGKISRGDEIIGLTRAFLYAGAPSIITTLWKVNDKVTYLLMKHFYLNLRTMGKAEALRTAQLGLMKEYHHPFFWAAFILNGDTE